MTSRARSLRTRASQLDTSSPEALRGALGRAQGDLDELMFALANVYAPRWRPGDIITAYTPRSSCGLRFGELRTVDTRDGSVRVYLPNATPRDAGLAVGFVKQIAKGLVHVQPVGGQRINGLTELDGITQVGFHYAVWNGSSWWIREPDARVKLHVNTPDTLGLWQFNDQSLVDSSGNGRTLTVGAGTARYNYLSGTLGGFHFNADTVLIYNVADAALRLTGDMTAMFMWVNQQAIAGSYWFSHAGASASETSANNYLYSLRNVTGTDVSWFQESGGGVDATATLVGSVPLGHIINHIAVTRSGGVVTLYDMGRPYGTASAALTTPTDGSSGRLRIGGDDTTFCRGIMSSFQLISRALSATEIMAARNYTLGASQGYIDAY